MSKAFVDRTTQSIDTVHQRAGAPPRNFGKLKERTSVPLRISLGRGRGTGLMPFAVGIPLQPGSNTTADEWCIVRRSQELVPVQTSVEATWPDGSVKWLLVVFVMRDAIDGEDLLLRCLDCDERHSMHEMRQEALWVSRQHNAVTISTGNSRYRLEADSDTLIADAGHNDAKWLGNSGCQLLLRRPNGSRRAGRLESLDVLESGPVRATISFKGVLARRSSLLFSGSASFYGNCPFIRLEVTVHNPRRARHRGGYWDLGDPGSVCLSGLSLMVSTAASRDAKLHWQDAIHGDHKTTTGRIEIHQASSGGDNWESKNHVNRDGYITLPFRGYRVRSGNSEWRGERANPVVSVSWSDRAIGCALEDFWQRFPSAISAEPQQMEVKLLPDEFNIIHELQAGEQCTRVVWLEVGQDAGVPSSISWVYDPPLVCVDPAWVAASKAIPFLPGPGGLRRPEFGSIVLNAIEGESSFFIKRETIDEFGWRNYGDMWADHEELFSNDKRPVISHYNNQYDLLYGIIVQYLQTGDRRWWGLADPLARHILDIDIYHTSRDRAWYNGGYFWHTAHYHTAHRSTHRSMGRAMKGTHPPAPGGGPCNEHNYTSGLLLYYYLTGCMRARKAVISLADWVIAMDDGAQNVLGLFVKRPTGNASRTLDYHGPGRGVGNSVNALMDGWLASGEETYVSKAIELIYRTIAPTDDIAAKDLLNAERRWSYTVLLQTLVRFIVLTHGCSMLSAARTYVLRTLAHYSEWMAANERFYLDSPDLLEYPTETWAAQELRKATVLLAASQLPFCSDPGRLRSRAHEMLDRAWQALMSFPTRQCTRPVALVLQQGYIEEFFKTGGVIDKAVVNSEESVEVDTRKPFVDQKQCARHLFYARRSSIKALTLEMRFSRWLRLASRTWIANQLRHWFESRVLGED